MSAAPTPATPALLPPYAAGAGDPGLPLQVAKAAGWHVHVDEDANVTCTSPDGCSSLQFGPETDRYRADADRLWATEHRYSPDLPRPWAAYFGTHVPAEAIAAFTGGWIDPASVGEAHPEYVLGIGASISEAVFDGAYTLGFDREERTLAHTGPYGAVRVSYDPAPLDVPGQFLVEGPHWRVVYDAEHGRDGWSALMTAHTPGEAIVAFLTALTDLTGLDPDRFE